MRIASLFLAQVLAIVLTTGALADPLSEGDVAYRKGDYPAAAMLYAKAAAQGSGWGEFNLADMLYRGIGVQRNVEAGLAWFAKAAENDEVRYRAIAAIRNIAKAHPELTSLSSFPSKYLGDVSPPIDFTEQEPVGAPLRIPMQLFGGTFTVPVVVNNAMTLNFTVDSGAAQVSIPADVFLTLTRTGTVQPQDVLDPVTVELADGSTSKSDTIRLRSLRVGNVELRDVIANIGPATGSLLLGQTFLGRFRSWSLDNATHELELVPNGGDEASNP
jgi:hypothetical protein